MSIFRREGDGTIGELETATRAMEDYLSEQSFKEPAETAAILNRYGKLLKTAEKSSEGFLARIGLTDRELQKEGGSFADECRTFERRCSERNRQLAKEAYINDPSPLCPVEGKQLDDQQLEALYTDLDTRLVISGAGSGKTTAIVGLAKHLFASGTDPEKVQFISFTNSAVSELRVRIRKETGKEADVKTFHRLGMRIISECTGHKPSITKTEPAEFIKKYIAHRIDDRRFIGLLGRYADLNSGTQKDQTDIDREEFDRKYTMSCSKGTKLKSRGEVDVADYLTDMGIPFEYEEPYFADTSDEQHSQYRPDFHITGTDVYIEFFGTDRNGNVAPEMLERDPDATRKYNESIEWKRRTHREHGTVLIETYAYQRTEGTLHGILEESLKKAGIDPDSTPWEISLQEQFGSLENAVKWLSHQFAGSMMLLKGTGEPWDECFPSGRNARESSSLRVLRRIIEPIYREYEHGLESRNEIDFQDILLDAAELVRKGSYKPDAEYMVVDEYQDISHPAYMLLKALRNSRRYRLFCVGDDWQSIYRFNGSDVSYIIDFEKYWGPAGIFTIDRTYRYSGTLLDMSSAFVMSNPRQIRKNVKGPEDRKSRVVPMMYGSREEQAQTVRDTVLRIPPGEDVLFIGRYHFDIMFLEDRGFSWKKETFKDALHIISEDRPDLDITFRTAHGSKGLQADNVFILNNRCGKAGFPSEAPEPPVFPLMLDPEGGKEEDERRLYYVSMTRARNRLFLLIPADKKERSPYIKELFPSKRCPECGGRLTLKNGPYGCFYGCSNYKKKNCRHVETFRSGL